MIFVLFANWIQRTDIGQAAGLRKQIILNDILRANDGSFWSATLMVVALGIVWQLLGEFGYFRVSFSGIVLAAAPLFSHLDLLWHISVSLFDILIGCAISGLIALIISELLSTKATYQRWLLPLLSLTFATPMIMLPAWHEWLFNQRLWQFTCVAVLSFFPLIEAVWIFRTERQTTKVFLAAEQALPYAFAAILYGDMMSATKGLGFAIVVATATKQYEKGFAIFLITLSLLFVLTATLRFVAKGFVLAELPDQPTGT
jgi:ABC-type nitrate/sulfonate/bicarbonate transport system permease component